MNECSEVGAQGTWRVVGRQHSFLNQKELESSNPPPTQLAPRCAAETPRYSWNLPMTGVTQLPSLRGSVTHRSFPDTKCFTDMQKGAREKLVAWRSNYYRLNRPSQRVLAKPSSQCGQRVAKLGGTHRVFSRKKSRLSE